jgi:hypothetical protein
MWSRYVEGDLDGERERVATAGQRAIGARSRLDAATAAADVLLLLDLDEAIAHLDDVDHLRRLDLTGHRLESTATARADAVGIIELEEPGFARQVGLVGRARRRPHLLLRWPRRCLRCLFRGLRLGGQLLDERQGLLQLVLVARVQGELVALPLQVPDRLLQLGVQRERHTAQLLDVLLGFERRVEVHAFVRSGSGIRGKRFHDHHRRRQRLSPDEVAALDEERKLVGREPDRCPVVAPQPGEAASLEPLLKDAEAGPVPDQDLARLPAAIDEQEDVAAENVVPHCVGHEPVQAVETLPQVYWLRIREDAHPTARCEDHPSLRSSCERSSQLLQLRVVHPTTRPWRGAAVRTG